jgi:hypothetical protein
LGRNADDRAKTADAKGVALREGGAKASAAFHLSPEGRAKSGALLRWGSSRESSISLRRPALHRIPI